MGIRTSTDLSEELGFCYEESGASRPVKRYWSITKLISITRRQPRRTMRLLRSVWVVSLRKATHGIDKPLVQGC